MACGLSLILASRASPETRSSGADDGARSFYFRHPKKSGTVTVPAKIFDDLQRPLIATIVKQVGLERKSR